MARKSLAGRVLAVLGERLDEIVLRAIFGGLVVATVFVVGFDVYERSQAARARRCFRERSRASSPSFRPYVPT